MHRPRQVPMEPCTVEERAIWSRDLRSEGDAVRPLRPKPLGAYQPMCSVVHVTGALPLSTLRHLRVASLRLVSSDSCVFAREGCSERSFATFAALAGTVIQ